MAGHVSNVELPFGLNGACGERPRQVCCLGQTCPRLYTGTSRRAALNTSCIMTIALTAYTLKWGIPAPPQTDVPGWQAEDSPAQAGSTAVFKHLSRSKCFQHQPLATYVGSCVEAKRTIWYTSVLVAPAKSMAASAARRVGKILLLPA